jgi:nitroreductase
MIEELITKTRSYRRYQESEPIPIEALRWLVTLARFSASGSNRQPLKFILSCDPKTNARIFPHTRWAGFLTGWGGPAEGERPAAYVVILGDTEIRKGDYVDHGIAAQSIVLGAMEKGIGGCMIGSIDRPKLRAVLEIPERYEILLIVALGKPAETVVLEDVGPDGSIKYYRDDEDVHHVPKRTLAELILAQYGN